MNKLTAPYLPLAIIASINVVTLAVYFVAPYNFLGGNVGLSYVFVAVNIAMLSIGYTKGVAYGRKRLLLNSYSNSRSNKKIVSFIFFFYLLTFPLKYGYLLRFPPLDFAGMAEFLLIGFADPQLGYQLSLDKTRPYTVSWSVFFLIAIFNNIYFVTCLVAWRNLSPARRMIFVAFVALEMCYWIGRGTNFGVVSFIVILFFANLLRSQKISKAFVAYGLASLLLAVTVFATMMSFRAAGASDDLQQYSLYNSYVDETSILFTLFPQKVHTVLLIFFSYVTQGYYYMSLAFDLDFVPTWLGGWNSSLSLLYEFLGIDVFRNSYISRLDSFGVDPQANWHSAYTWLANDVSFYGVPVVMLAYGFALGLSWANSVVSDDLLSKILFVVFASSAMFLFANTNFASYYFYSLMFLVPVWLFKNFAQVKYRRVEETTRTAAL